jgi:hypothetical protein
VALASALLLATAPPASAAPTRYLYTYEGSTTFHLYNGTGLFGCYDSWLLEEARSPELNRPNHVWVHESTTTCGGYSAHLLITVSYRSTPDQGNQLRIGTSVHIDEAQFPGRHVENGSASTYLGDDEQFAHPSLTLDVPLRYLFGAERKPFAAYFDVSYSVYSDPV